MSFGTIILIVLVIVVAAAGVAAVLAVRSAGSLRFDIGGQTPRAAGGDDASTEATFKGRFVGLGIFSGTILGVLVARLFQMQVVSADDYTQQAESNRTRVVTTVAPRGRILDRNGVELVTNRPSLTVTASSDVADDEVKTRLLANLLGMPYMACRRKVLDTTEGAQSYHTVGVDVRRTTVAFLQEHVDLFDGVAVEQRTQRAYPQGDLACHVLGYTGTVTEDQIKASADGKGAIQYESGDTTGQAGVEYQYEDTLQGVRGEQTVYVDADGNVQDYSTSVAPESGSDVVLTIDANVQRTAEESLAKVIEKQRSAGNTEVQAGAAVVVDVTNGEVLAMASCPTFRPELFVGGISQDDWDALSDEAAGYPLLNRAVSGQYMAASTIKPLTTFAALDYGIANEQSGWTCSGWWTGFGEAYGKYCWKHSGHGSINLRNGIVYSCDTVFYEVAKGFYNSEHQDGMQETFRKWGLGSATGVDLPSEATGRVPDADWKWNYFSSYPDADRQWQGGDYTNIAIGQGDILVTPLQMACVYAGLGTKGTVMRPHVLKGIRGKSGDGEVISYESEQLLHADEADSNYDLVHSGLEGVIYEESEAMTAHFSNLSMKVAGKTGTGEYTTGEPTGWFCAYVPADDPKYAISAVVDHGGFGSSTAMFVVRDIIGALYDEPDTSTVAVSDSTR